MKKEYLQTALIANRAEEYGQDVWEHFVLPLFYDSLDLFGAKKARVVRGGRGCGKTMLLRYLSHQSQFSKRRGEISEDTLSNIGIYWRSDTAFAAGLKGWGLEDEVWNSAFIHSLTLKVSQEILQFLINAAESKCDVVGIGDIEGVDFSPLSAFDENLSNNVYELYEQLTRNNNWFQTWVNNPKTIELPIFLPGKPFLEEMVRIIRESITPLSGSMFYVYVDEYENLQESQQKVINTYLKHGEPPLLFNIAVKRNGIKTYETVGNESIQNIADFRVIDLDELMANKFELFAAEVLFSRIVSAGDVAGIYFDIAKIKNIEHLKERSEKEYRERVVGGAERMFPGYSQAELADVIFSNKTLLNKLKKDISQALKSKGSRLQPEQFIREDAKQASIVCSCLLNRRSNRDIDVLSELDKYASGENNKFSGKTNWIHNNFVGEVLRIHESSHSKVCPIYSGFNSFAVLSRGNLRHFLELCYRAIRQRKNNDSDEIIISQEEQAAAAREASISFVKEIRGLGRYGNRLHAFVLALGSLFSLAHSRKSQSEPEINHFVISKDGKISDEEQLVLNEAVKWSILFEEEETKVKQELKVTNTQWVLNPIYAPYFLISYRKRRKIELSAGDVSILISGDYDSKKRLLSEFMARWELISNDLNMSLFSHMDD